MDGKTKKDGGNNLPRPRPRFNVLVTSISNKIPLLKVMQQAAGKLGPGIGVIGADINNNCLGRNFVKRFWQMPKISDLAIKQVIGYCRQNKVKAVIPTRDNELLFWSKNKGLLEQQQIKVMVSEFATVNICLDKLLFYNFLKDGLPVIKTSDKLAAIKAKTYVVKERFGAGSLNIGLNLNKADAARFARNLKKPIFQPYLKGKELSLDAYVDLNGTIKGMIARSRDLIINGESQITTMVNKPKLEKISARLITVLKLYGHLVLQIMEDEAGDFHFIECNSRFGGASTLSVAAGLDSFYWFLLEASGRDIGKLPFNKSPRQLKQIRYPNDVIL